MSLFMSFYMSILMNNLELPNWDAWLETWLKAFLVAYPFALIMSTLVRLLTNKIFEVPTS